MRRIWISVTVVGLVAACGKDAPKGHDKPAAPAGPAGQAAPAQPAAAAPVEPAAPAAPAKPADWPADLPLVPGGADVSPGGGMALVRYPTDAAKQFEADYLAAFAAGGWHTYGADKTDRRSQDRNLSVCKGTATVNVKFSPLWIAASDFKGVDVLVTTQYTPDLPAAGCPTS